MQAEVWHVSEYERALQDTAGFTPAEMVRHMKHVLRRLHVEVLAHGNIAKSEAAALAPAIVTALLNPEPLPEAELPTRHTLKLPDAGSAGGAGEVVVELEAATEEEMNSAVQVLFLLLVRGGKSFGGGEGGAVTHSSVFISVLLCRWQSLVWR